MPCPRFALPFCVLLFAAASLVPRAAVVYVNQNSPGTVQDGVSWPTAFLKVQDGLNAATPGDEVWVAAAAYAERVALKNGVALYGGFAGTETRRDDRSPQTNVTVLDGGHADSVVTADASITQMATLDGFTIQNGAASSVPAGGGIRCVNAAASISNNVIVSNSAMYGGGVYAFGGAVALAYNTVFNNTADEGAGLFCGGGTATVSRDTIFNNHARNGGGIAQDAGGSVTMADCVVQGNTSDQQGAGVYVVNGSMKALHNSIAVNSAGGFGGGIFVQRFNGVAVIARNYIASNVAGASNPNGGGGGVYSGGGNAIADNLIVANQAPAFGGGVETEAAPRGAADTIANNTVVNNTLASPSGYGGGIGGAGGTAMVVNNIVAGNTGGIGVSSGTLTVRNNDVYGNAEADYTGLPDATGMNGNSRLDPKFLSPATGDYHLFPASPCVNSGDDTAVNAGDADFDGVNRILGPHVDMGAYEAAPSTGVTLAYAARALRIAGGLAFSDAADLPLLDAASPAAPDSLITLDDAVRLAQIAAGAQ